jgi:hypothetical protein
LSDWSDLVKPSVSEENRWFQNFPITGEYEFDWVVGGPPSHPIAIREDYPPELVHSLSAAALAYAMGNRSVDYTARRYLPAVQSFRHRQSLGSKITRSILNILAGLERDILKLSDRSVGTLGEMISELNLARSLFTLRSAVAIANKGGLFEVLVLMRFLLEQLAWIWRCRNLDDEEEIMTLGARQSIKYLKQVYPTSGSVYGWLSDFAHWLPDHHQLFVEFDGGRYQYVKASGAFKAISLAHILLLLDTCLAVYERIPPVGTPRTTFTATGAFRKRRHTKTCLTDIHRVAQGRYKAMVPLHLLP